MDRSFILCSLVGLTLLSSSAGTSALSKDSPREVLEKFCELDAQGKQLTPDGRNEIVPLFMAGGASRPDKIIVVRDFIVSHANLKKNRAEFYVEYIQLGQIDPATAKFFHLPPVKVRAGFDLVLTNDRFGVEPDNDATQTAGPAQWRIEGSPPEPHLTVDSAFRYAKDLRDQATDDSIRKNAELAIAALRRLLPPSHEPPK